MLKELTEEESKILIAENPGKEVVIFYEGENKWYDIRGKTMEEVGESLMEMADKGQFDK